MSLKSKGLKVKRVTISLDPTTMRLIDEERGLAKRSTYIDFLLKKQLLRILKERKEKGTKDKKP